MNKELKRLLSVSISLVSLLLPVSVVLTPVSAAPANSSSSSSSSSSAPAPVAESDFKSLVRDLHENLKRFEGDLEDIEREAGRRQMIANSLLNNDTFISDPWDACMPANLAGLRNDSTRPGPYLTPRKSFLNLSLNSMSTLNASIKDVIARLPAQNTFGSKIKVDIDVMSDARASLDGKISDLKTLCQADSPDKRSDIDPGSYAQRNRRRHEPRRQKSLEKQLTGRQSRMLFY